MEAGSIAENFYLCNLLFCGGLESLQVFAWNHVPMAIAQLKNEQVQSRSRPVFHFRHARLVLQVLGAFDRSINFGIGGHDRVPG